MHHQCILLRSVCFPRGGVQSSDFQVAPTPLRDVHTTACNRLLFSHVLYVVPPMFSD